MFRGQLRRVALEGSLLRPSSLRYLAPSRGYAVSKEPSPEYLAKMGNQPDPDRPDDQDEADGPESMEKDTDQMKKNLARRSRRMSLWQMFLVTLIGSCVLNIMREKNEVEELEDNYRHRFEKFDDIIAKLQKGETVIEEIEKELAPINDRFQTVFNLPASNFTGLRGLDKDKLRELYHVYRGVPLETAEEKQKEQEKKNETPQKEAEASAAKLDKDTFL